MARLEEIKFAVSSGASEIDIVINRQLALSGSWQGNPQMNSCTVKAHRMNINQGFTWYRNIQASVYRLTFHREI